MTDSASATLRESSDGINKLLAGLPEGHFRVLLVDPITEAVFPGCHDFGPSQLEDAIKLVNRFNNPNSSITAERWVIFSHNGTIIEVI
jgi:hypothetical protein